MLIIDIVGYNYPKLLRGFIRVFVVKSKKADL